MNPKNFYDLDVKALDQKNHRKIYDRLEDEDRQVLELDFGDNPDKLQEYLVRIDMTRASSIKVEEKISFIRTRVYGRKAIRWNGMSDAIRHRSK